MSQKHLELTIPIPWSERPVRVVIHSVSALCVILGAVLIGAGAGFFFT
jgi:hypothetical protein